MLKCTVPFALSILLAFAAQAQPGNCNAPAPAPSVTVELPGPPFAVKPTRDGCWAFVSVMGNGRGNKPGIAVLKRGQGRIELSRVAPLRSRPIGMVLTHDEKLLIAAAGDAVVFLDVERLKGGAEKPLLGSFSDGPHTGSVYANVTSDDGLLFVSEESRRSITVIDLERARKNGFRKDAIIGAIPTGNAPIALTFSPDGKWLYTTSQGALPDWNWPKACRPEGSGPNAPISRPEGAVVVVDVERARKDPAHAVAARVPAGCSPVRLAISPDGGTIYVTARNSNAVLVFDAARLVSDGEHARLGMAAVGTAPVPVAVVDGGRKVVAGNSNRFGGSKAAESLTVLDAAKIRQGVPALLGTIPAGAFPREMAVSADGATLFLTNFGSNSLQVIDLEHLPMAPNRER